VTCYAESSAVLAWLLGEARGGLAAALLGAADLVVTSELTLVEVDRVLHRAVATGAMDASAAERLREQAAATTTEWAIEPVSAAVVDRARHSFPHDAIRALDAIHLATAVVVASTVGDLAVLSFDERVRVNAVALGLRVVPD
jgi:predicted nucleic acid-binding protein